MREIIDKKILILSILTGAFFIFSRPCFSQNDSIYTPLQSQDSVKVYQDGQILTDTATKVIHAPHNKSPRVALISSAVLPGLGQVYNGKYWKVPIIYGGGAVIYYFYDQNNDLYKRCKNAINDVDNNREISDPDLKDFTRDRLVTNRDNFRRDRDYTIIFMGLLYVANIVDAMVDAYMVNYDVSRDLTLQVKPTILPSDPYRYMPTCGLTLSLSF